MAELQSIEENMSFMSNKLDKYNVQLNEMRVILKNMIILASHIIFNY